MQKEKKMCIAIEHTQTSIKCRYFNEQKVEIKNEREYETKRKKAVYDEKEQIVDDL